MAAQNYSAIDDLVKKHNEMKYGSGSMSRNSMSPHLQSNQMSLEKKPNKK